MSGWISEVRLGDLHEAFKTKRMTAEELAQKLLARLMRNVHLAELVAAGLIAQLKRVKSTKQYDEVLARLYDFGDAGHRIWFRSDPQSPRRTEGRRT